jgi:hypothetical protein
VQKGDCCPRSEKKIEKSYFRPIRESVTIKKTSKLCYLQLLGFYDSVTSSLGYFYYKHNPAGYSIRFL